MNDSMNTSEGYPYQNLPCYWKNFYTEKGNVIMLYTKVFADLKKLIS